VKGGLRSAGALLYAGAICWVIGYDTVYALQDREDDALVGVKSSARRLGGMRGGVASSTCWRWLWAGGVLGAAAAMAGAVALLPMALALAGRWRGCGRGWRSALATSAPTASRAADVPGLPGGRHAL
jgi:4-hydroxybenzoate polyprenyltransferase